LAASLDILESPPKKFLEKIFKTLQPTQNRRPLYYQKDEGPKNDRDGSNN
jgi:hypothetical protein